MFDDLLTNLLRPDAQTDPEYKLLLERVKHGDIAFPDSTEFFEWVNCYDKRHFI